MIFVKEEHFLKANDLIRVTEEGIFTWVNDEHPEKAENPIWTTEGNVICFKEEHSLNIESWIMRISPMISSVWIPLKANFPILVTEEGIIIWVNEEHLEKA